MVTRQKDLREYYETNVVKGRQSGLQIVPSEANRKRTICLEESLDDTKSPFTDRIIITRLLVNIFYEDEKFFNHSVFPNFECRGLS